MAPPDAVDELYSLDPDEFTAARDQLARERSKAGDKTGAAAIKKLRKPAVTAWALNQAARKHREEVDGLLAAGDDLRAAQQEAVTGGSAAALREATRHEQQAVSRVIDRATEVLRDGGREPTVTQVERMTGTLRAAAAGGEAADLLSHGRLTTDLSPAGFGLDALLESGPLPARPARPAAERRREAAREPEPEAAQVAAEREKAERARLAQLAQEAEEAEARAGEAERAAGAAEQRAEEAEQAAVAARHEAREAARAAAHARKEARDATARWRKVGGS